MAVAALKKFWNYLVGESEEDYAEEAEADVVESSYDYNLEEDEEENSGETFSVFKRKNKIVNMPQTQSVKMKIFENAIFRSGVRGQIFSKHFQKQWEQYSPQL